MKSSGRQNEGSMKKSHEYITLIQPEQNWWVKLRREGMNEQKLQTNQRTEKNGTYRKQRMKVNNGNKQFENVKNVIMYYEQFLWIDYFKWLDINFLAHKKKHGRKRCNSINTESQNRRIHTFSPDHLQQIHRVVFLLWLLPIGLNESESNKCAYVISLFFYFSYTSNSTISFWHFHTPVFIYIRSNIERPANCTCNNIEL